MAQSQTPTDDEEIQTIIRALAQDVEHGNDAALRQDVSDLAALVDAPEWEVTELNGVELTDLDAAREALDYLNDDYNDGSLTVAEGGTVLVVTSRSSHWGNFTTFQQAEGVRISNARAVDVGGENDEGEHVPDVRLVVEIREADR